jgi:hypothetical protein
MLPGESAGHDFNGVVDEFGEDQVQFDREAVPVFELLLLTLTLRGVQDVLGLQVLLQFGQFVMQPPVCEVFLPRDLIRDNGLDLVFNDAPRFQDD